MSLLRPVVLLAASLLSACAGAGQKLAVSDSPAASSATQTEVARGLAFAGKQCSGCHALQSGMASPNPQAPSFVAVANDLGFTETTLREFFRDKHDTPASMSITLDEEEAGAVAAYIMSLRTSR